MGGRIKTTSNSEIDHKIKGKSKNKKSKVDQHVLDKIECRISKFSHFLLGKKVMIPIRITSRNPSIII